MQEADNATLANICLKFFSFEKESDERTAEVHRRLKCPLTYGFDHDVTLDVMECKIRYRKTEQQIIGQSTYCLAEGYDEGSAFKFFILVPPKVPKPTVVLGGEVQNIWNQTMDRPAR